MKSRSASLTGATGFVGWHVASAFRDAGWRVRAVVRPGNTKAVPDGVDVVESALDAVAAARAFDGTEVVVHCAALVRAQDDQAFAAVNVAGTRAVVEAANAAGARLLLMSSLAAVGTGTMERPRVETDAPAPINAYGRSKRAAEQVVREVARTPWTILRPCAVYGPRDRGFLPLFRLARYGLSPLPSDPATAFTLVHVTDLARAVLIAADPDRAGGETYFIGHPRPLTTTEILAGIAKALDRKYRPLRLPPLLVKAAATLGDFAWTVNRRFVLDGSRLAEFNAEGFVCSTEHARTTLGFTADIDAAEGLADTASWYRIHRWI